MAEIGYESAAVRQELQKLNQTQIDLNDEVSKLQSELLELTGEDISADNTVDRFARKSRLNKQLKNWRDFLTKNTDGGAQNILSMKIEKIEFSKETLENGISTTTANSANEFLYFIKLGPLLNWIQNNLLLYNKSTSTPYFKIDTGPNNYCMHYSKHISADPEICLIPVVDGPIKQPEYYSNVRKRIQESLEKDVKDGSDTNPSSTDKNSNQYYGALPAVFQSNAGGGETIRKEQIAKQAASANFDTINTLDLFSGAEKVDKIPLVNTPVEAWKETNPNSILYITKNRYFQYNVNETTITEQGTWTIEGNRLKTIKDSEIKPLPQIEKARDINDVESGLGNIAYKNGFIVNNYVANLMEMHVNLNFIAVVANNNIDEKGNLILINFLNQLLTGINAALGYFHNFEVVYDREENSLKIYDNNILKYGKLKQKSNPPARFNLYAFEPIKDKGYSLGSFIYDVNFTSQLSNNFTNMITISSQADTNILGMGFSGLSQYNSGLEDRIIPKKQSLPEINKSGKELSLDDLNNMLGTAKTWARTLWNELSINRETVDAFMSLNRDIANYYINKDVNTGVIPSPTVIPYNLSFSMMGLAGMKIFERFDTDEKILPPMYDNTAYNFVIKSISHEISNNKWTTTVESQVINKEDPKAPEIPISSEASKPIKQSSLNVTIQAWDKLTENQRKNAIYLYNTCLEYNFTDSQARAIVSVAAKETGFIPKEPELSYSNTPNDRIREVFPSMLGKYSDTELTTLKKDNTKFWEKVYGGKYGNDTYGDGEKYRGRGFNGITFKGFENISGGYKYYNKIYASKGSKAGKIDIVSNPDNLNKKESDGIYKIAAHICALYFDDAKKSHKNQFDSSKDNLDKSIFYMIKANAGWASSETGNIFREGLAKALAFSKTLPKIIE